MHVLAGLPLAPALDAVVTGGHSAVGLHLHVGRRVGELALDVGPRAPGALELAADLQLEPEGVLAGQHHPLWLCESIRWGLSGCLCLGVACTVVLLLLSK